MKLALLFWGLTRSLKYTIKSINKNILNIFKEKNIDFDIFLHTYKSNEIYNNYRTKEKDILLNFDEYKLLNPTYFIFDDLEKIKKNLNLELYRSHKDPWNSNYNSVDNFILSLYSKKRVINLLNSKITKINIYEKKINKNLKEIDNYELKIKNMDNQNDDNIIKEKINQLKIKIEMLKKNNEELTNESNNIQECNHYDYVLFLRPDVKYKNKINLEWLKLIKNDHILIPNFCIFNDFNDRFFASTIENAMIYGNLFDELLKYSKIKELHSETFHYELIIKKYKIKANLINFYFNRVRANGKELINDFKSRRVDKKIIEY